MNKIDELYDRLDIVTQELELLIDASEKVLLDMSNIENQNILCDRLSSATLTVKNVGYVSNK